MTETTACPYTASDERSWIGDGPNGEILFKLLDPGCTHEFHPDLSFFAHRNFNCCRCLGVIVVNPLHDRFQNSASKTRTEVGRIVAEVHGGTYVEAGESLESRAGYAPVAVMQYREVSGDGPSGHIGEWTDITPGTNYCWAEDICLRFRVKP